MEVCFSLRSEAVGAMRTAMVSAENLQLTLRTEPSQEEQALTHSSSSPKEAEKAGYCSKIVFVFFIPFQTREGCRVLVNTLK